MGRKSANDYHLWVDNGSGTYNRIKGQGTCNASRNGQTIDASAKEDFPYGAKLPGMRDMSIALEINVDLPDATGYTRCETLANATTPVPNNFQIRKGGTAGTGGDVVFQGSCYITDFNTSFGQNEAVKVNLTLVPAAAPTVDTLA